jgi:hypothetical protein
MKSYVSATSVAVFTKPDSDIGNRAELEQHNKDNFPSYLVCLWEPHSEHGLSVIIPSESASSI